MQYLAQLPPLGAVNLEGLHDRLRQLPKPVVRKEDWARLEVIERDEATRRGLPEFKFASNAEMLAAMGLVTVA